MYGNGFGDVVDTSGLMNDVVDTSGLMGDVGVSVGVSEGGARVSGNVSLAWIALVALGAFLYFKK